MPRTREHAERYADALSALATATHRPTSVVNNGEHYAIRVDFAFGRHLLATNTEAGLSDDPDATVWWTVRFYEQTDDPSAATVLAEARAEWLVDAFDTAIAALRADGDWAEPACSAEGSLTEVAPNSD